MSGLFREDLSKDRAIFDDIYHKYHQVVYANIFKLVKSDTAAEDILQDVFFSLWENRQKIDDEKSPAGWLFVVSYNKSLSYLKKKVKDAIDFVENYDNYVSIADDIFTDKILVEDQLRVLEEAVNQLSPQRQKVFKLCKLEGKSQEETANILGLSKESVKSYLKEAKKIIKDYVATKDSLSNATKLSLLFIMANI
ncbi:RNA polymerase sigma factor [Pedobacter xixiisoli]|uniref:RNA polymerase sigma-70 factor, ECF subfamily n=1 Tax=Pedobacter xixiisoli TaxID=1476464 RepID=A0A286ACY0_9SPHI|nr:sigma-70 family RNA polymerase sigma factor [Pedobacter xixiisoli]SOD19761.1 RNA polymerase sigma-70 factor, ECF subfamily [Pedobacter xixiisoli]